MTAKDLNFSFDSGLAPEQPSPISPVPSRNKQRRAKPPEMPPMRARSKSAHSASRAPYRRTSGTTKSARRWPAVAVIALLNMVFLALAGLWLTGNTPGVNSAPTYLAEQDPGLQAAIEELRGNVDSTQAQLGQQLQAMQSAITEQRELLLAMSAEISRLHARPPAAAPETSRLQTAPVAQDWHINLGSFANRKKALDLQALIRTEGYPAALRTEEIDGEHSYRVLLNGFDNRASADIVAKKLMETTDLNGLWVWNGE